MGCTLSIAAACTCATTGGPFVGSPRRPRTVVGRAAGPDWTSSRPSRSACPAVGIAAGRRAGDIVEPAGSGMGPAEARHAPGTASARHGRLGPASRGTSVAADRGALLGRAGPGRVGCAEDRGARSYRRAVMVCASRASGRAGRCPAAVERARSDCR